MAYSISVRTLCGFTAKQGDLDRRFTPAPTAQQGMQGHAKAAARRGSAYQTEVTLTATHQDLMIRGRADGYEAAAHRLDEFKTFRGDFARMKANHRALHWAQLKSYGAMLCMRDARAHIDLALVYFDIESQQETILTERAAADELIASFTASCGQFAAWAAQETAHQTTRNAALLHLAFPYSDFHAGQRVLAEAAYKASHLGQCVLAQAPTGIGKTVGTLFPLLKAMGKGKLDKIFYLAAKSTGRQLALDAVRLLTECAPDAPLRVLDLVAREKACVYPGRSCHGDSCPLAKGFYDRLAGAREAAVACQVMDQPALRAVGDAHQVCPYYLSQEMVRWADVVVGDYNYYFDDGGLLYGLQMENEWRIGLLVDEAHNLIERARLMHTMALSEADLLAATDHAPPPIKRVLRRLAQMWTDLCEAQTEVYTVIAKLPAPLLNILQQAVSMLTDLGAEQIDPIEANLERFYFAAMRFCQLAEEFGEHSLFDISGTTLCIRNVIPAPFIKSRLAAARCSVLFSATLTPPPFYRDMLGLPANTLWLDVPSPFSAEQLKVRVVDDISTRWDRRASSLNPISSLVARQYAALPGNYLVFLSSFDYLQNLFEVFSRRCPHIPTWQQHRSMSEAQRQEFMARFVAGGSGVGFAVLGGAFAEGVDLPGERLIGAFVATLGLPQVNAINDAMAHRLQASFGAGHEYTYLYPGLQKVSQAAGRVIRSTDDRGTLYLIDERYARPNVRRHLPRWWNIESNIGSSQAATLRRDEALFRRRTP
ncbi:MAG: excision repair protein [Gammaproteobacteria bacterium]|nr:excision repair protein [Gammaproteobacteria bacterium]